MRATVKIETADRTRRVRVSGGTHGVRAMTDHIKRQVPAGSTTTVIFK